MGGLVYLKRGDTLAWRVSVTAESGDALDISAWSIACQVRTATGELVESLHCSITNPSSGEFSLVAPDTSGWPLGRLLFDIQYTVDGTVISTDTGAIRCVEDITRP